MAFSMVLKPADHEVAPEWLIPTRRRPVRRGSRARRCVSASSVARHGGGLAGTDAGSPAGPQLLNTLDDAADSPGTQDDVQV